MSRNLTVIVSSILFVVLAALLVLLPVPFVTWRPGATTDVLGERAGQPVVEIEGIETFKPTGRLLMTTVSASRVDASVSLPESFIAYFGKSSEVMPRDVVFPPDRTGDQVREEQVVQMDSSRTNASVAAMRAAGQQVTELPMVTSVTLTGPAVDKLKPGDLIESVDGGAVANRDDVVAAVRKRSVGEPVVFRVIRDGARETVSVVTAADSNSRPVVGISVGQGFQYAPQVTFNLDSNVVGPSAGLVFALAIYDKVSGGDLLGDATVAGTGAIDPTGSVSAIGGVRAKIAGAGAAGASIFLLPQANCADLGKVSTNMQIIPVASLRDAIAALQLIKEGQRPMEVPSCE